MTQKQQQSSASISDAVKIPSSKTTSSSSSTNDRNDKNIQIMKKYSRFVEWMIDNDIQFSSLLTVAQSSLGGIGVFARKRIPKESLLLTVPKPAVLSPAK